MEEFVPSYTTTPPTIGCLAAVNASLWFIVADAEVGREWRGGSGDDPHDDFTRAMEYCALAGAPISIGEAEGAVCTLGSCGMSNVWRAPDGITLLAQHYAEGDDDSEVVWQGLASRSVEIPSTSSKLCASVVVSSGCLALMLPYVAGTYTQADIERASKTEHVLHSPDEDLLLISVADGRYDVWVDELVHEDELGMFDVRVRIVRAK